MSFRKGKKVSEIPPEELKIIQAKERDYTARRKTGNIAGKIVEELSEELGRPISKQEITKIEMGERQKMFVHYFYKYDGNIAAACTAIGIARSTFNIWRRAYPDLVERISELDEAMLDLAEQQLFKNIANGKENSLFFLLCNKGKGRGWQDVRKLAAPKPPNIKINVIHATRTGEMTQAKLVESVEVSSDG